MSEYAKRKARQLEPHYSKHVMAMTAEGLHEKSDIAAELAYRDQQIEWLSEQFKKMEAENERLQEERNEARMLLGFVDSNAYAEAVKLFDNARKPKSDADILPVYFEPRKP